MSLKTKVQKEYTLALNDLSATDTNHVGAKAANVAALLQAGFLVPTGFVLTTDAFSTFLAENNMAPGRSFDPDAIVRGALPAEILDALYAGLAALGEGSLAVRSSAVAEDLPDASFAGQYETFLNVSGPNELETAVRRCWASAFKEHVAVYRERQGLKVTPMAVLVQKMVPAEAAGVAFTANPVSGARGELVVNAVRGLGERLVSGQASPDEWIVRDRDAHCQKAPEEALTVEQVLGIAKVARQVESHFGSPQDIEWAIADGQLYLLQTRPITTLPNVSSSPVEMIPIAVEPPPGYWVRNADHQPQPTTPMNNSVFRAHQRTGAMRMFDDYGLLIERVDVQDIGGWEYIRMVPVGGSEGPELPNWLMWLLVRIVPMIRRRIKLSEEAIRTDRPGHSVRRWYDEFRPDLVVRIGELRDVDLDQLSDRELEDHLEAINALFGKTFGEAGVIRHLSCAFILYDLVVTCRELLGWDEQKAFDLVVGTSNKSTEPARRLFELTQLVKARPTIRKLIEETENGAVARLRAADEEFTSAFDSYLKEYGCRALRYEVAEPTLAEMPDLVLELIRGQIATSFDPTTTEALLSQRRMEAAAQARGLLAARPVELARFNRVLERAERAYPIREENEFYCVSMPVALLRYAVLELGERLAERGVLGQRDDVFYLSIDEARAALSSGNDMRAPVKRRKGERAWAAANPGPPSFGQEPGDPPSLNFLPPEARLAMEVLMWYFDPSGEDNAPLQTNQSGSPLRGTAVSAGEYTGLVRVIMNEGEFHKLQPGDILVCPTTSPVWSVLFPSIGALVTDTGGMLSHPAIIAREYRVPAVVATGNATELLRDGQIVTVNGSAGTVIVKV